VDTLILTSSEVADLLEPRILLGALRDAFVAHSTSRTVEAMRYLCRCPLVRLQRVPPAC
jgi:hypothetical protein